MLATYNALSAAVKDGGDSSTVLTNREALVSLYEAAHNACQPQARRRSLLARDTPATVEVQGASLSDAQLQARQALFAAAATVSVLSCVGCIAAALASCCMSTLQLHTAASAARVPALLPLCRSWRTPTSASRTQSRLPQRLLTMAMPTLTCRQQ